MGPSFSVVMSGPVGFEDQVTGNNDPQGISGADGQGWRAIDLAADDVLSDIADGALRTFTDRGDQRVVILCTDLGPDRQQGGQASGSQQVPATTQLTGVDFDPKIHEASA